MINTSPFHSMLGENHIIYVSMEILLIVSMLIIFHGIFSLLETKKYSLSNISYDPVYLIIYQKTNRITNRMSIKTHQHNDRWCIDNNNANCVL